MAETNHHMDIDSDDHTYTARPDKAKSVVVASNPAAAGKAIPWVEKYRPLSLDDVAAHRDIVDTSKTLSPPFISLGFMIEVFLYLPSFAAHRNISSEARYRVTFITLF